MTRGHVRPVVTGAHWMGLGVGSVQTALSEMLGSARDEVMLTAYSITSGTTVLSDLSRLAALGRRVTVIINRLTEQEDEEAVKLLLDISGKYCNFLLYDFSPSDDSDLHAKVVVVDREIALVGSSNLSWRGLSSNHELGVVIEGPPAREIASTLDALIRSGCLRGPILARPGRT